MKSSTPGKPASKPEPPPSPALRRRYRIWDAGILGALAIAFVVFHFFSVAPDGSAVTLGGAQMPGVCAYRNLTGQPCPGCGMTRALVLMSHGQWRRATAATPAAWPMLGFLAVQVLWRLGHCLAGGPWANRWAHDVFVSLGLFYVVMVIPWLGRLLHFW